MERGWAVGKGERRVGRLEMWVLWGWVMEMWGEGFVGGEGGGDVG